MEIKASIEMAKKVTHLKIEDQYEETNANIWIQQFSLPIIIQTVIKCIMHFIVTF